MASQTISLWNTFYHLAREVEYAGPANTEIFRPDGSVIATVPRAFVDNLCVEGSGKLADGRVINTAGNCAYGPPCLTGAPMCYRVVDATRYPWGIGVQGRPLVPLRSLAVDPHVIPYGSDVFIPEWAGVRMPAIDGIGGFVHDGHFTADDTGGWIVPRPGDPAGSHIDIFAGTLAMYHALDRVFPTRHHFTGVIGGSGGRSLKPALFALGLAGALIGGAYFYTERKNRSKWLAAISPW